MRLLFTVFLVLFLLRADAFEITDTDLKQLKRPLKHPCPLVSWYSKECEVLISVPNARSPSKQRDKLAQARFLCENFPIPATRRFSSRLSDGEGHVFVCYFNRDEFLLWWETYTVKKESEENTTQSSLHER